jgi:hypothetical protein
MTTQPTTPGPAITSANLSSGPVNAPTNTPTAKPVEVDKEQPIVAKPLVSADFTNIKPKNPMMSLYWGNRIANGGLRIEDLKARGFRLAKPDEVQIPDGKGGFRPVEGGLVKDGHVQRGDLLCLIIPKADYEGQLKLNQQTADRRVSKAANAAKGKEKLNEALREVGGLPARYQGKIGVFVPSTNDLDKLD